MENEYSQKKVSIIIPCFNDGKYLLEAIYSVENYNKRLYELIIVDDGSTDKFTIDLLKKLRKKGYDIIRIKHQGVSVARNIGVKNSKYDYLLFLDSDDKINPGFIPLGIKVLEENPEIGIVYGDRLEFGTKDEIFVQSFEISQSIFECNLGVYYLLRKKVWLDCDGFDKNLVLGEDWEFLINASEKGWKFFHIPKISFYYRKRTDSASSLMITKKNRIYCFEYIYEKHKKLFIEYFADQLYFKNNLILKLENEHLRKENEKLKNLCRVVAIIDSKTKKVIFLNSFLKKIIKLFD